MDTRFYVKGLALVGLAALLLCGQSAFAAGSVSATGHASATIITPLTIAESVQLNFGTIAPGTNADTLIVSPSGSPTIGSYLQTAGTPAAAAAFTVNGQGTLAYAITLPSAAVTLTSGADSMSVDTFVSTPSGSGALAAGTQTVNVGATLHVGASQAAGSYTGTYSVTVAYQ